MSYIDWTIKSQDINKVHNLASSLGCSEIVARLLINRGLADYESASNFLNLSEQMVHDPFMLNDIQIAVDRILFAIKNNEKICIYGDYDVDGITSVSVLYLYLKHFTDCVEYFIPNRFSEGYGVNDNAIKTVADNGVKLIITVDTGISAFSEVEYASSIGVDVVITDHHECQDDLPNAVAVVNPKRHDSTYPFKKLAGVGVVYKLISALDLSLNANHSEENIDLVAIGTIADIMPLLDENRFIVRKGLEKIQNNANVGLRFLIDKCINTSEVTASNIGYAIAPRINAAGRIENAEVAVKLFVSDNFDDADIIAEHLCKLNVERQKIENSIFEQAIEIIEEHELDKKFNALVLWKEDWHSGVIGVVASRLKEKYNKPVVLFSVNEVAKGSGRSVIPFNLYEAFESCKDILIQYGGHKYAAGVLIENSKLCEFRDRLSSAVTVFNEQTDLSPNIDIECVLEHNALNLRTFRDISLLQPYGKSNEIPLFCVRNVRIVDIFPTANNKHLRIKFGVKDKVLTGFYFGVSPLEFDYRVGDLVDIVCELNKNEYKNISSLQLIIRDMRYVESVIENYNCKRKFCDNSDVILPLMLPTRNDIGIVYRFFVQNYTKGRKRYNLDTLSNMINKDLLVDLNFEKVYFSFGVLLDLGIILGEFIKNEFVLTDIAEGKKFSLYNSAKLLCIYQKAGVKFGD